MKGKTVLKIAAIGAFLYGVHLMQQDASLTDKTGEAEEQKEQFRRQLEEDIRKAEEAIIGLPNPVKVLSWEDFAEKSGKVLNYAAIESLDPLYYMINKAEGDKPLFGIKLTDSDGIEYDFRFVRGRGEDDISGMYCSWSSETGYPEKKPNCRVFLNETGQGICLWKDRSKRYSLSAGREASLVKLVWMKDLLMRVEEASA